MRATKIALRMGAVLLVASFAATPLRAGEPTGPVADLNATLLESMQQARELGFNGRYELLSPVLIDTFNFPAMARIAVGRYWTGLDKGQRGRLIDAFSRMSIANFASRFDGYSGERFEMLGERPSARGAITVLNQIVESSGKATSLDYVLREFDGDWQIIDIFLDGKFSELAVTRSEYTSVIGRAGFDSLISTLDDKFERLATRR